MVQRPLFGRDTEALAREMVDGLRAMLCCVDTQQFDAQFSGASFDAALVDVLPATCDPCAEKGEFHTLVHAGPMFDGPVPITRGEGVLREARFVYTELELAGH
ncbi:hypothetical protein [Cognatilysobacter bugurensis]|uniref:Diphthamide synthase domain-containing protein n=1 Tax=Cognatilysobacter bugurensis TaxID=543356 RepID=A0A918W8P1_9GAMM|nr:hypothetical protein [Lysobacter bugurensis]GHA78592.1 hypothetical protein GCM10007067_14840 [Lysobacter bugurensis]